MAQSDGEPKRNRGSQQTVVERRSIAIGLLLTLSFSGAASAQCQYEVVATITAPPCPFTGPPPVYGRGINNHGHVCGYYADCDESALDHAFYWTPETGLVTLPEPEWAFGAVATDISDEGLVCGYYRLPSFIHTRAFVFKTSTGEMTYLEPLQENGSTGANAINNNGVIAGWRSIGNSGSNPYNAMIWDTISGEVTDLGVMNGPNSTAIDINATGDVAGNSGIMATRGEEVFLWRNGKLTMLGPVPAGFSSHAHAVNDYWQVTANGLADRKKLPGIIATAGFWENQSWIPLGVPDDCIAFAPAGLNNAAQIIGSCTDATNHIRPVLWQHGSYADLEDLINMPSGLAVLTAGASNNTGNILLHGSTSGDLAAVLLAPINVPLTDLDINCRTDVHDLLILLHYEWGETGSAADFNDDGVVNVLDILILLSNWS